jgi:hypothetical protein
MPGWVAHFTNSWQEKSPEPPRDLNEMTEIRHFGNWHGFCKAWDSRR